jgi:CRP-like cAMP-binding protein
MKACSKIKTIDFMSQLPMFNELAPADLDHLASRTTEMHVPRGEVIYRRGDDCCGFHTVVYGRVKLAFTSPQGAEKVVEIVGPGHTFGEALMFADQPHIVSAQALTDTMLLHVSKSAVLDEIDRTPQFARKMLAGLSKRLYGLLRDVEAYSLSSGTRRVIGYLLQETPNNGEAVCLHASKAVVASRLNLTPEHFSRILHDLVEHRMISMQGREITVLDLDRLRTYER